MPCSPHSLLPLSLIAQAPSLAIQVDHPTAQVSPTLYGLMTEEINFSYDGGLYPELVRDRTIGHGWQALAHWTMVARGNSAVAISVDETTGPSAALPRSLKVSVTAATEAAPAGVQNDGFWGIPVRPQTTYTGSFYAKSDSAGLPVTVSLVNDETGADRGHGDGCRADERVEAIQLYAEDRRGSGHGEQSSDPDHSAPGDASGSIWSRSFRPPTTTAPSAIAST